MEQKSVFYVNGQPATGTVDGVAMNWSIISNLARGESLAVNLYVTAGGRPMHHPMQSPVTATNGGLNYANSGTLQRGELGWSFEPSDFSGIDFGIPRIQQSQNKLNDTPTYTEEKQNCNKKLAGIFGDSNAVAADSGFEPLNLFGQANRGKGMVRAGAF